MKTGRALKSLVVLCGSLFAVGSVAAQPMGRGFSPEPLTKSELTAKRDELQRVVTGLSKVLENFSAADTDGDGSLSADELTTYAEANNLTVFPGPPHERDPRGLTKDQLTRLRNHIAERRGDVVSGFDVIIANFSAADSNGDGRLSRDEMETYAAQNGIELPRPGPGRFSKRPEDE